MEDNQVIKIWTKEKCQEEGLKYTSRTSLKIGNYIMYIFIKKNGWLDEICSNMISKKKPKGYWIKERCQEEALKYNHRIEFQKGVSSAYKISRINGWLDEICAHMIPLGSKTKKFVYLYTFTDNSVYIGLTYNYKERNNNHLKGNSRVYDYIKLTGLKPKLEILTIEPINTDDAVKMEINLIKEYREKKGYNVLNISGGGGLGGGVNIWTKEKCQEESLKYTTRTEFSRGSTSAYNSAYRNCWLNDICNHMIELSKPNGYWTKEKCHEEALKYTTRTEFNNGSRAYNLAHRYGWLNEICSHMKSDLNRYWTKEKCHEEALKYTTRTEFNNGSGSAYHSACKASWLDEICDHMISKSKPNGYWTKEKCHEEALKYNHRIKFKKESGSAYTSAQRKGWLYEICSHMIRSKKILNK